MNRKTKNIIMSIVLVLLIVATIVTIKCASDSKKSNANNQVTMNEQGRLKDGNKLDMGGGTPPNMNNGSVEMKSDEEAPADIENMDNDGEIPLEKPDGDNDKMGEPPSMNDPFDDNDSSSNTTKKSNKSKSDSNKSNSNNSTSNEDNPKDNNVAKPPSMENNGGKNDAKPKDMNNINKDSENNKEISTTYYVLFGLEGLSISLISLYLIMSKGNKTNFRETFQ